MIEKIFNKKINNERDKIEVLIFLQAMFLIASELTLLSHNFEFGRLFFLSLILFIIYLIRESFQRLFYTFWSLVFILIVFELYRIFSFSLAEIGFSFLFLKIASVAFLFLEVYYLSSPIFYPRVNWWEYDFRFKSDFKVDVSYFCETLDGRMTDLRRGCGCILVFRDLNLGDKVKISLRDTDKVLEGEVFSRREQVPGRPRVYGIKFDLDDSFKLNKYKMIAKEWKNFKNHKRELKSIYGKKPKSS